jgi:hypothetical protein
MSFHVDNDSYITVTPPDVSTPGNYFITVTAPAGSSRVQDKGDNGYEFIGSPTVTGVSANAGPTSGGNTVTITGTNFYNTGSTDFFFDSPPHGSPGGTWSNTPWIHFGVNPASSVVVTGDSTITATAPAGSAGSVDVIVQTASGTSVLNIQTDAYTYYSAPSVTGISPVSGPAAGGNTVTIYGTNISRTTAVSFGGSPATDVKVVPICDLRVPVVGCLIYGSNYEVTATAPAKPFEPGVGSLAENVDVTVITPGGTSAISPADLYSYPAEMTSTTHGLTASDQVGSIAVTSDPSGAAIKLDGTDTGQVTPCTLNLVDTGWHDVIASLTGYNPEQKYVNVTSGSTATADIHLTKSHKTVVTSTPGVIPPTEETSSPVNNNNPGDQNANGNPNGYVPVSTTVPATSVITAGITVPVNMNTQHIQVQQTGSLAVTSTPTGAEIWINGQDAGQVTPYTFTENSGTYQAVVKMKCYTTPASQAVTVSPVLAATADFSLSPEVNCNSGTLITHTVIRQATLPAL